MEKWVFEFKLDSHDIQEMEFQKILNFDISMDNIQENDKYYYNESLKSKNDYKKSIQNIIIAIKLNWKILKYHLILLDILSELKRWLEDNKQLLENKRNENSNIDYIRKISQESFQYSLILIQIENFLNSELDLFVKNNFSNDDNVLFVNKLNNFLK